MKNTHHKLSLHFIRCTVLTPLPLNFATSRMEYPLRSKLITSLYSAFICSDVETNFLMAGIKNDHQQKTYNQAVTKSTKKKDRTNDRFGLNTVLGDGGGTTTKA